MSRCVLCAQPTPDSEDVCSFHLYSSGEDWARGNRIMCDFLHRGIVPPVSSERGDLLELLVEMVDEPVTV